MPRRDSGSSPPTSSSNALSPDHNTDTTFRVRIPLVSSPEEMRARRISFTNTHNPTDPQYSLYTRQRGLFGHSNSNSTSDDDELIHSIHPRRNSADHDHIRWSNDDNFNIIPRVLLNDNKNTIVCSTSFFKNHPTHVMKNNLSDLIQQFGLMAIMNNNMVTRRLVTQNISSSENSNAGIKRNFEQMNSSFLEFTDLLLTDDAAHPTDLKSSFVQPGLTYTSHITDDLITNLKFTEVKNNSTVRGFIESGTATLDFKGEIIDFVNNDLRSRDGNKGIIEGSIFNNLLRNNLCFDKDLRKFIGRHKRTRYAQRSWKPFFMNKSGYLKLNGYKVNKIQSSKETKFPNSSLFHKVEGTCGNKCGAYKTLSKWFDLPPFNEFINTPSPPTPPNGRRKHLNNPEDLLVCTECQNLVMNNFILVKLEIDLEDLLKDPGDRYKDLQIKNDMSYKHLRRIKPMTSSSSSGELDNSLNTNINNTNTNRTRGLLFDARLEDFRTSQDQHPRRISLLDYLISRQQAGFDSEFAQHLMVVSQQNFQGGNRRSGSISSDSDASDEEFRQDYLYDYDDFSQPYTNNEEDDEEEEEEEENDADNIDELYEIELSSGRSRRIENLLFERNLTREQQHHRRGGVLAKKLYKNSSSTKLKLQMFVSINRLTGEFCMVPGNLDKNNWSAEENNGDLFEDYEALLKMYEVFMDRKVPLHTTEIQDDEGLLQKQIDQFKNYIDNHKFPQKERVQKLLLLLLLTSPYLNNLSKNESVNSEKVDSPVDLTEPQISETFSSAGMRLSRSSRKNLQHEDDDFSEEESKLKEERFNEALIDYFNENFNFNFDFKKVLRFKPCSSNNMANSRMVNKGSLNCFDSFYSFSYC